MNREARSLADATNEAGADGADNADGNISNRRSTAGKQSEALLALVKGFDLFTGDDGTAFVSVPVRSHRETIVIDSVAFKQFLARAYYDRHQCVPSQHAVDNAVRVLSGRAVYESRREQVAVRLAEKAGAIYLDLGNENWEVVRIDARGWEVTTNPPVHFRRPNGMQPLPRPEHGGTVDHLREFVNVGSDDDFCLLIAALLGAFQPNGPYPLLEIYGPQGSAKSTLTRIVRGLVDPNTATLRAAPRGEQDLMIAAKNGWLLSFDNLSDIPKWLSDALCRVSTGGGQTTRRLYTDDGEVLFDARRPALLNGIHEVVIRGDLADRTISLELPPVSPGSRRSEEAVIKAFDAAAPKLLGALLDGVSAALRNRRRIKLATLPRLADFMIWCTAGEDAFGWSRGTTQNAYLRNRNKTRARAVYADSVGALLEQVTNSGSWTGTATELLKVLEARGVSKQLPKTPAALGQHLHRLAPDLASVGIALEWEREGHEGNRVVHISRSAVSAVSGKRYRKDGASSPGRRRVSPRRTGGLKPTGTV